MPSYWIESTETELVERFDAKYAEASPAAKIEVTNVLRKFQQSVDGIGVMGAKVLYICLHDYLNASDSMRAQLRRGA